MEQTSADVEAALAAIVSAELSPTEHLLLRSFVDEAVDPSYAAQYILHRLNEHSDVSPEEVLRSFKQDWRRLAVKCESPVLSLSLLSLLFYFIHVHRCSHHLSHNIPVSTVLEAPLKAVASVHSRDGPHCCMVNSSSSKGTETTEVAYIIPPTLFEDHELHPQVRRCALYTLLGPLLTSSCSPQGLAIQAHGGILDSCEIIAIARNPTGYWALWPQKSLAIIPKPPLSLPMWPHPDPSNGLWSGVERPGRD